MVEQLVRLPRTAWCYRPPADSPDVSDPPFLRRGHITFAAFNSFSKVTHDAIAAWSRILAAIPGSHLMTKSIGLSDPQIRADLLAEFARHGIDGDRIEILPRDNSTAAHLSRYHDADIALDTFPYCGTTTTCEALWMGIPLITIAGTIHMSRVGVSLLTNVGLPELIATSVDDYVARIVGLAQDRDRLARLRRRASSAHASVADHGRIGIHARIGADISADVACALHRLTLHFSPTARTLARCSKLSN